MNVKISPETTLVCCLTVAFETFRALDFLSLGVELFAFATALLEDFARGSFGFFLLG